MVKSNKDLNQLLTAEELAARAAVNERKRAQRGRERSAKELHAASLDRQAMWATNRLKLQPEQIADLERRQSAFIEIAWAVRDVTENLKPGVLIGPPNGVCYPDAVFQSVQEHLDKTNPINPRVRRIVWHPNQTEFASLHEPDNKQVLDGFASADPEWFSYGVYTRFQDGVAEEFVKVCADYIRQNPNHPDIDPDIAATILAERAKSEPRKTGTIITDTEKQANIRQAGEIGWVENQNNKQYLKSLRDLSKIPFKY